MRLLLGKESQVLRLLRSMQAKFDAVILQLEISGGRFPHFIFVAHRIRLAPHVWASFTPQGLGLWPDEKLFAPTLQLLAVTAVDQLKLIPLRRFDANLEVGCICRRPLGHYGEQS